VAYVALIRGLSTHPPSGGYPIVAQRPKVNAATGREGNEPLSGRESEPLYVAWASHWALFLFLINSDEHDAKHGARSGTKQYERLINLNLYCGKIAELFYGPGNGSMYPGTIPQK